MNSLAKENNTNPIEKMINIFSIIYIPLMLSLIGLQIVAIFKPINLYYVAGLLLTIFLTYFFLKNIANERDRRVGFVALKIAFFLFIYDAFFYLNYILSPRTPKSMGLLMFIFATGLSVGIFASYMDKKKQEALREFDRRVGIGSREKKKNTQGDIQICVDEDTKKPVRIPFQDRFLHMLILGPTGSGKTSQVLIPMINQDINTEGVGLTVIEPKGDLAEKVFAMAKYYNKEAVYFNPTHPDCPYFNPLFGEEDEVIENMATTFKMLNMESPQFFQDMNENLVRNSLKVLKRLKGNTATLIDLSKLIFNSNGEGKTMISHFARLKTDTIEISKENAEIAFWFQNEYFNERSRVYEHCSGIRSQVAKITSNMHLRRVLNPPNGENDVDFTKMLDEGGILAISTAQGELRDLGRFLGYFIILNFQSAVFKRPGNENTRRAHFLYIDEFQEYANPGFSQMLTQGRSYRVASHLATQNRALIGMGSGKSGKDFVDLVSTNARNLILFPGANANDAKYYSAEFGEMITQRISKSTSQQKFNLLYAGRKMNAPNESVSVADQKEAKFSASDIIFKEFGQVMYKIIKGGTIQTPGIGKVSWIPIEMNRELERMVAEYEQKKLNRTNVSHETIDDDAEVLDILKGSTNGESARTQSEKLSSTQPENKPPIIRKNTKKSEDDLLSGGNTEGKESNESNSPIVFKKPNKEISFDLEDEDVDDLI